MLGVIDMRNNVQNPAHYNYGEIETIDVIEDWDLNFNIGNAVKYLSRYKHKENPIQDLEKAIWYIHREIERLPLDYYVEEK